MPPEHSQRGTDDSRHIWRVVSVFSDGRRKVENSFLTKGAAELLAEDIRLYREEQGLENPRLVVEKMVP